MKKFRETLEIKLDNHQNNIENKEQILKELNNVDSLEELDALKKYYYQIYELSSNSIKRDMESIAVALNDRINIIKTGEINITNKLEELKEKNSNLKNISIVETQKEDNDKINGMKREVTYLKITVNGQNELYEVTNKNAIYAFLSNSVLIDNMSETEIINNLREHANLLETTEIDRRENSEINSEQIKEEIRKISDPYVREAFENEENLVLQERVEIKKYLDKNMPGEEIEYGLNSNGERIYLIGDKIIKFVGEDRELKVLTKKEDEKSTVEPSNFNRDEKGSGKMENININEFENLEDFGPYTTLLNYIIESVSMNLGVTDNQIEFFTEFIEMCITREEMMFNQEQRIENAKLNGEILNEIKIYIPGELLDIYEKYVGLAKENPKFTNPKLNELLKRKAELDRKKSLGLDGNTKVLEEEQVKKLTLKNDNPSSVEKAGFISVAIILESSLIIGGILAILALVKR